jgi:hypothetical protein
MAMRMARQIIQMCSVTCLAIILPNAIGHARADQLWAGGATFYWGKIISINNSYVEFQVNCTGEPRRFTWKKEGGFSVTFAEGCKEVNLNAWGEPTNCKGRGRLFQIGNEGRAAIIDFISYENDTLMLGYRGKKAQERSPRKEQIGIWMACS